MTEKVNFGFYAPISGRFLFLLSTPFSRLGIEFFKLLFQIAEGVRIYFPQSTAKESSHLIQICFCTPDG